MSDREEKDERTEEMHDDTPTTETVPTPPSVDTTPPTFSTFPTQELTRPTSGTAMMTGDDPPPPAAATRPGVDVPIISEDVVLTDLSESRLRSYVSQAKEAYCRYFPEGREPLVQTDRAMILLAKGVTHSFFDSHFLPIKARYLLDENLDLYIRKVPGDCHGQIQSQMIIHWGNWSDGQGLFRSIGIGDATKNSYSDKEFEPDVAIYARSDGKQATPRCVIEIEVNNQSPRESKELAGIYFQDPNVRAVVLIKIWNRRTDSTFAAACVVWIKDQAGNIECLAAHDFGTAPIAAQARNNLSNQVDEQVPPLLIPSVPVDLAYTLPQPDRAIAGRDPQIVNIPALPILVNASNEHGQPLADLNPPIQNLELNLSVYVELIEMTLP